MVDPDTIAAVIIFHISIAKNIIEFLRFFNTAEVKAKLKVAEMANISIVKNIFFNVFMLFSLNF